MVARSVDRVGPRQHKRRLMIGGGWWRRRATVPHDPVWIVLSFAADGDTVEGCWGEKGCTETRVVRALGNRSVAR